jgi:glycosyltransferase involved in cell wall biosynthesis
MSPAGPHPSGAMNHRTESERIRVARVIARLNVGGPALHVTSLTARLPETRFESRLLTGDVSPSEVEMVAALDAEKIDPIRIPGLGRAIETRQDLQALMRLVAEFRQFRPHIVHTHTAKGGALGRVAARLCGVPIVVHTFHGHVFEGYFSKPVAEVFLAIERGLGRLTTAVVTISPRQHAEITGRFRIVPARKAHIIPLGFDLRRFDALDGHRGALRSELKLGDAPVVSIIGRLVPIKDHPLLFRAVREIEGVELCVVGGGECEASLRSLAIELGMVERVHFMGFRTDLERILADTDVVALTSVNEGTPVALIEALAAGCPVAAVAVGGVADVLEDGRWGRIAAERTPAAVATILRATLRERFGRSAETIRAAKRYAREKYSIDRLVRDHVSLYECLLARAGRTGAGSYAPNRQS